MREENSAGGVVVFGNAILMLKKYNGDWVLPKGKIEEGEDRETAAIREVKEESGIKGQIVKYLGEIHYTYRENWDENKVVHKTVFWYLMNTKNMCTVAQKEEGFISAEFIHAKKAIDIAKYDDEREIIKVVSRELEKELK